ncbi:MAG: metallophosphoesterase family protein [Chloroflexota bacterium]
MKIVHFADLHLDAPFAWTGATGDAARRRRQELRDALRRIVALVGEVHADALFCGGDLYEHELVTPDTAAFLHKSFAELNPTPVFLAPGNHDWFGPRSLYATDGWSPNVHVFRSGRLEPVTLADGLTLWGGAHLAPANTRDFLDGFRVEGEGVHVALFHGAERSWLSDQEDGKQPHAPFDALEIEQAGLHHAFLGHYHRPRDAGRHTYPGNPVALTFGEDGDRGAVIATIAPDGGVMRERRVVAERTAHDVALDVTGCRSREEVRARLRELVAGLKGVARVTLEGELDPDAELQPTDLRDAISQFDAVMIRTGALSVAYDIEAISQEATVRGQFARDMRDAQLEEDERRRALVTGLRAMAGRNDLEVL